jgi:hypothetical protein
MADGKKLKVQGSDVLLLGVKHRAALPGNCGYGCDTMMYHL